MNLMDNIKSTPHSLETDFYERFIVGGFSDGIIRIFLVQTSTDSNGKNSSKLKLVGEYTGHEGPITKAAFITDNTIVSSDFTGKMIILRNNEIEFNTQSQNWQIVSQIQLYDGPINDFCGSTVMLANGAPVVLVGCEEGSLRVVRLGDVASEICDVNDLHKFAIKNVACNDEHLVTSGLDGVVYLISFKENNKLFTAHSGVEKKKVLNGQKDLKKTSVELEMGEEKEPRLSSIAITPTNCFNRTFFAIGNTLGKLWIIEYVKKTREFIKHSFDLNEPIQSIKWGRAGFSLSVSYGVNKMKGFVITEESEFEEVEIILNE